MTERLAIKKTLFVLISACVMTSFIIFGGTGMAQGFRTTAEPSGRIALPEPLFKGKLSTEEALQRRRSVRKYQDKPLTLQEISQLLWAAQGITGEHGKRTAPSAGALYPIQIYLVSGSVDGLPAGIYRYRPKGHELLKVAEGDKRRDLSLASFGQESLREGAASVVIAAVYEWTTVKYGDRGMRYVHMEVGGVAENIYLQAVSLGIGTVFVGAYDDERVKTVVNMGEGEEPLAIMPLGRIP